ncbi:ATP-binding cassette domain-containing protein [Shewanella surugensis]|uniref:ATP-binding cassette domain-containing protein n=1 Tax=Shewanella surugensis TaxID=212020 RepID=A0ABT0L7S7_9GAMM|nr:ATP-binding cassette domain-containing protein [Shewanella surugensis]MCL1123752.1 ATP-binding cassette domain-containing protein [Shewanella surugensis]
MEITFEQFSTQDESSILTIPRWIIEHNQSWAIFCPEGEVGSLLANVLGGTLAYQGQFSKTEGKIAQVSLGRQQLLLEEELAKDETDFLDVIDAGTSVYTLIYQECKNDELAQSLLMELDLLHLKDSGFRQLSSGETRRVMLARSLATKPDFLILDNVLTGLDVAHRQSLVRYFTRLSQRVKRPIQMMVVFSREEDMPDWIEHIALFNQGGFEGLMDKVTWNTHPLITQIKAQSMQQSEKMMALIRHHQHPFQFDNPVFEIKDGQVNYLDNIFFTGVNWRIENGDHWQIKGPNGCGKSTLLGLIFGDHPQCYSNDIDIFGRKRGSGETIWEIKKHIGMVSSALHLQYRVNCSALQVILSGFYDSIGLYSEPTRKELALAKEWLAILHMSQYEKTSFRQLAYSQQRLLLIARAIVKQPRLLILDEPYQGLDYLGRRLMKNTLELIAKENLSQLLYVSHYQNDSLDSVHHELVFVYDEALDCYRTSVMHKKEQPE